MDNILIASSIISHASYFNIGKRIFSGSKPKHCAVNSLMQDFVFQSTVPYFSGSH